MGLAYIAAYLGREGHNVRIVDCVVEGYETEIFHEDSQMTFSLKEVDIKKNIWEFNPGIVSVSAIMSSESHNTHNVCRWVKKANKKIVVVVGGTHASAMPELLKEDPNIDHIVIGEGEESIAKIVEGEAGGIVKSELVDVNKLPWPARHLLSIGMYWKR